MPFCIRLKASLISRLKITLPILSFILLIGSTSSLILFFISFPITLAIFFATLYTVLAVCFIASAPFFIAETKPTIIPTGIAIPAAFPATPCNTPPKLLAFPISQDI